MVIVYPAASHAVHSPGPAPHGSGPKCPPNFAYDPKTDTCVDNCPPGTVWQDGHYEGDFFVDARCVGPGTGHGQQSAPGGDSGLGYWPVVGVIVVIGAALFLLAR